MTIEDATIRLANYVCPNGDLHDETLYLAWDVRRTTATLDGDFTANELEAIAVYMRAHAK